MKSPRYTVLGSTGFVGSRLLAALKKAGADCHAPARGDDKIFTSDLGTVFYSIGLTNDYRDRPFDTVEAHVSLLSHLLAVGSFDRLIYLSSTRLYDSSSGERSLENADLALNPANPRHLFDLSKALGENICLTASDGRASVARLSSVYESASDAPGFLSGLLQRLSKENAFTVDSDSGVVRDYIHVNDVVNCLIKMAEKSGCEIVNVASGENISNQDIADCLNKQGFNITLKRQTPREVRPICDITKLKALGVKPLSVQSYFENNLEKAGSP